jgi:hypothetical protein
LRKVARAAANKQSEETVITHQVVKVQKTRWYRLPEGKLATPSTITALKNEIGVRRASQVILPMF